MLQIYKACRQLNLSGDRVSEDVKFICVPKFVSDQKHANIMHGDKDFPDVLKSGDSISLPSVLAQYSPCLKYEHNFVPELM